MRAHHHDGHTANQYPLLLGIRVISKLLGHFFPRFFKAAPPLVPGGSARMRIDGRDLILDTLENCTGANESGVGASEADDDGDGSRVSGLQSKRNLVDDELTRSTKE